MDKTVPFLKLIIERKKLEMNAYEILKEKHQKAVNELPIFFAFSNEQFNEGMKELGLKPHETDKLYSLKGLGGFYLKTDAEKIFGTFEQNRKELAEAIKNDKTGDGFIYDMFDYELSNHEFVLTGDTEETLSLFSLTKEMVANDPCLAHGLEKAIAKQKKASYGG